MHLRKVLPNLQQVFLHDHFNNFFSILAVFFKTAEKALLFVSFHQQIIGFFVIPYGNFGGNHAYEFVHGLFGLWSEAVQIEIDDYAQNLCEIAVLLEEYQLFL